WRAVAQGKWAGGRMGILVLNPTGSGSLTDTGGGRLTVSGASLIVNSNAANGAIATGGGIVNATEIDLGGFPRTAGSGTWIGTVNTNQPPTPDPLAYLPE